MLFTTVSEYAIRSLTHLAVYGDGKLIQAKHIAEVEDIPRHFLAKILNRLTNRGLVRATRGPGGGFALARPAAEISVRDVLEAAEGFDALRKRCVLGLDECRDDQPCPLHESWSAFREQFLGSIEGLSLAAMGDVLRRKRTAR